MNQYGKCHGQHGRRGHTSFDMNDTEEVFRSLNLKNGDCFVDLGCGQGEYSLEALKYIGTTGKIYAMDSSHTAIHAFSSQIERNGHSNIKAIAADITQPLLLPDDIADVCFISMVLHIYGLDQRSHQLFQEIRRILKTEGRLAIIECKKQSCSYGPPIHMRISIQELESFAIENGFKTLSHIDLHYNYMVQFTPD